MKNQQWTQKNQYKQSTWFTNKRLAWCGRWAYKQSNNDCFVGLGLRETNQGNIYVILDNAGYYHSKVVKDFLKEHPHIPLRFLLPCSPNLNIIECLREILKKKVTYNKSYLKFDHFREKVIVFFENEHWGNQGFKYIPTDDFQIIKLNFSGFYL